MTRETLLCRIADAWAQNGDVLFEQELGGDAVRWRSIAEALAPQIFDWLTTVINAPDSAASEARVLGGIRGLALQILAAQNAAASTARELDAAQWQLHSLKAQGYLPS